MNLFYKFILQIIYSRSIIGAATISRMGSSISGKIIVYIFLRLNNEDFYRISSREIQVI